MRVNASSDRDLVSRHDHIKASRLVRCGDGPHRVIVGLQCAFRKTEQLSDLRKSPVRASGERPYLNACTPKWELEPPPSVS